MTTSDTHKTKDDLSYVRSVLDRAEKDASPAVIYYLWAILSIVGFATVDLKPEVTGLYWLVAGPGGGVASMLLARRHALRTGQGSRREGIFNILHWTGMTAAIFLALPLALTGALSMRAFPALVLLILAFGYYTAGIYLDRRLLYVGIVVGACYGATFFMRDWPWTFTFAGTVIAACFVVSAQIGRLKVAPHADAGEPS